jgi:hypothetical protein
LRVLESNRGVSSQDSALNSSYLDVASKLWTGYWRKPASVPTDRSAQEKEQILSCTFDQYELGEQTRRCLILTYQRGIQIWDIEDLENVVEIHSKRDFDRPIKSAMILPTTLAEKRDKHKSVFSGHRPVLAILCGNDGRYQSSILFYSLSGGKLLDQLTLNYGAKNKSKASDLTIHSMYCNRNVICLVSTKIFNTQKEFNQIINWHQNILNLFHCQY